MMAHDPLADLDAEAAPNPLWDETMPEEPEATKAQAEPSSAAFAESPVDSSPPADEAPPEPPQGEHAGNPVQLGESLMIQDVAQAMEAFRQALELGGAFTIDAANLEQIDGAGLQLLCAALRDARAQGVEVVWRDASERLRQAARDLGVDAELAL
jgi:anti-anti-sigma regulatory factor